MSLLSECGRDIRTFSPGHVIPSRSGLSDRVVGTSTMHICASIYIRHRLITVNPFQKSASPQLCSEIRRTFEIFKMTNQDFHIVRATEADIVSST